MPLVIAAISVIGTIIAALLGLGGLLVHPNFEVKILGIYGIPYTTDTGMPQMNQNMTMNVRNVGWVQGKQVQITVLAPKYITIDFAACPEPQTALQNNNSFIHQINLERLSVNVDCNFVIHMPELGPFDIVVTAENSPPYKYNSNSRITAPLFDPEWLLVIILVVIAFGAFIVTELVRKKLEKIR